jgi:heme-degrading monooxygenase HmoA
MNKFAPANLESHYAVIFTSQHSDNYEGYEETALRMLELAQQMPGYLGVESVGDESGFGITISYWQDLASIKNWRKNSEHKQAQAKGKSDWYKHYEIRIAKISRAYSKNKKL